MLSDEEKKAIDKLKRSANYFVMPIYETKIILELIEKQSKEIEELKEENENLLDALNNSIDIRKYWVSKDKIKAKIEDLKENSNGDDFNLTNVIMILQSLLRKE